MNDKIFCAAGMMSGTSVDGVDVAIIFTNGSNICELGPGLTLEYDLKTRQMIKDLASGHSNNINDVELAITQFHIKALQELPNEYFAKIDLIGMHGHTIMHNPKKSITKQIGNPILMLKQLPTIDKIVYDFRNADIKNGGQGAPIVAIYHKALVQYSQYPAPVAVVNIGGIANLTYINNNSLVAFDTGPGNCLLDDFIAMRSNKKYDQDGLLALSGKVNDLLVEKFLADKYFSKKFPKSLDRYYFNDFINNLINCSLEDGLATLAACTAASISKACNDLAVNKIILCGGGVFNQAVINSMQKYYYGDLQLATDLSWHNNLIEAHAFGFLAVRKILNLPQTFPDTTGCKSDTIGGVILNREDI